MRIGDTYYNRGACKNGALIRMGALIDKNTSEWGALIRKGAIIGRRALNKNHYGI